MAWVLADRGASAQDLPGAARCAGDVRGEIVAVDGSVQIQGFGGMVVPGRVGLALCARDEITTGARSRVEFRLVGKNTTTGSSSNSVTVIPGMSDECVTLRQGIMAFISSVIGRHCVRTPLIDGGIDGTEAVVVADPDTGASFLMVREGVVTVTDRRDPEARIILTASATDRPAAFATPASEVTAATAETVPPAFRSLLLQSEAATDWAVYYPPIMLAGDDDPVLAEAADLLAASDPDAVDTLLAGRGDAGALALRSIAAVFRNRGVEGLELAKQAVASDPDAPPGHIAESYANQALGGLDRALESAERAVATGAGAEDAFAWARLAELHLTLGQSRSAARAVARSLALGETALARSIEGFAALARNRFAPAEEAFRRAIALDSELPLARLGLGLAAIRQGDLATGRQEIETATALDPRAASLRGWLGRAYLAEGESEKAGNQFALAQQADPDDPNAYLFEALRLFNANRPAEALSQVERAQSSGEARSVLRSAAGLGEDRAVQSS
ncbi:MAG: tetratricopeptide repeat protein, partial [Pseudomonadota bacterium]